MSSWISIAGPVLLLLNFILQMTFAIKSRKTFREDVLPPGLMSAGLVLIIVRETSGQLPIAVDISLAIICSCLILVALVLNAMKFKRYLKTAWWLDWKREKK